MNEVFASIPTSEHDKTQLGAGVSLVDLLALTTLVKSKREAREFLQSGSVSINGRKVGPEDKATSSDLLHGSLIALRRGKKELASDPLEIANTGVGPLPCGLRSAHA